MKRTVKVLPVFLIIILITAVIGCGGGGDDDDDEITVEELVDGVTAASQNIETVQLDMDMAITVDGDAEGEPLDISLAADASGAEDTLNNKLQMEMNLTDIVASNLPCEAGTTEDIPQSMEIEMYFIDYTMYIKTDAPGTPQGWIKTEAPGDLESQFSADQKTALLESSEIDILGEEDVNGVDCWAVTVVPNLDKLQELIMPALSQGIASSLGGEGIPAGTLDVLIEGAMGEILDEILTNISLKQWYAKDTFFPMKSDVDMTLEINSDILGFLIPLEKEFDLRADMELTILSHDFNVPVSIELPPDAESATELSPLDVLQPLLGLSSIME